jgi:predicted DNA-binding transcriptional regulator YafY
MSRRASSSARGARAARTGAGRTTSKGMTSIALAILNKAAGADPPTIAWVRQEFGVTERQAFRYLQHAKEAGMELVAERRPEGHTVYRLPSSAYFRPEQLSVPEAIATAVLTHALLGQPLQPDSSIARSGADKIRRALDKRVAERVRHLQDRLSVRMVQAERPTQPKVFHTLVEAILADVSVLAGYRSPYLEGSGGGGAGAARASGAKADPVGAAGSAPGAPPVRATARRIETIELEPFALVFARRSWYLVARRTSDQEVRTYKLSRFTHASTTSRRFAMPRHFTVDGHLGNAWELVRAPGARPLDVELVFDPSFAGAIADTRWHRSQRLTPLPDGSLRFQAKVDGTQEILWWILGMGSHVRVVGPPELVKAVREETARMMAAHGARAGR